MTNLGSFKAATDLVDILDELGDPKLKRRVVRYVNRVYTGYARLDEIKDDNWFRRLAIVWRKHCLQNMPEAPDKVRSYLGAIVRTHHKQYRA